MSDASPMTTTSSGRRLTPPFPGLQGESKRRRKVRTCTECRRRKLACDQATPVCGRCLRAGHTAACQYYDDLTFIPMQTATPATEDSPEPAHFHNARAATDHSQTLSSATLATKVEQQHRRIAQLEEALNRMGENMDRLLVAQSETSTQEFPRRVSVPPASAHPAEPEPKSILLKGSSFKTRFYGVSFPESLIAHIPKLSNLSKEIVGNFPILLRLRQDVREIEGRTREMTPMRLPVEKTDLLALLPAQHETDQLVQLYLENFEYVYHVLHLPSFLSDYRKMWANLDDADAHLVALVLLMVAISQCLRKTGPWMYTGKRSAGKSLALSIIQLCEYWLGAQRQKRVTIFDFQIRILLCLARNVNGTQFKRSWIHVGTLLRYCMAAGLHKDPELLSEKKPTSMLEKEMRRRLWTAVLELELQTSFTRGMISAPLSPNYDYITPININDDDMTSATQSRPMSRPIREFTGISYLVVANMSLHLRMSVHSILNDEQQAVTFDMAKHYTEQLEAHLDEIPPWSEKAADVPRTLLLLSLCNTLLALHDRHIRQAATEVERKFSKTVIIDTVAKILNAQRRLLDSGCHAVQLLSQDHLRATLSACHTLSWTRPSSFSRIDDNLLDIADCIAMDTVEILTDKVERLGGGQQQLWIAVVASALVKIERTPADKATHMQQAVDRMTAVYYKILACQQPSAMAAPKMKLIQAVNGVSQPSSTLPPEMGGYGENALTLSDIETMPEWAFDEWSLELS
ncbi:hypothetical protein BDY17DRAFT_304790 [Neohortaea acidophila]|uniref:Zn(2)-C6 fungal-type domain-containing protein n=1 Tax=Neohortaea acidophila TaxID=245834 RepID=A0A6A6PGX2_9PEZI|nr:uncharacterized protein BDY17DRAFT_304790 [Neohortaea acidophila]KAF2478981.1 hypothetical protein BDY17DRAFT_304790 [Neohortaea acidophila]